MLWELLCLAFGISDILLPRPTQIIAALIKFWPAIWPHTWQTLYTTVVGFAIGVAIGLLLGILVGSSKLAFRTAYPLLVGFSSIQGRGRADLRPLVRRRHGPRDPDRDDHLRLPDRRERRDRHRHGRARARGRDEDAEASKLDILWNVSLPRAMPYFFAALKVAITLAFVGSVVAETVASNRGIGNMMMIASSSFNVPLVFAGLFVLAALGVALYLIFSFIENRVTGWAHRKTDLAAA